MPIRPLRVLALIGLVTTAIVCEKPHEYNLDDQELQNKLSLRILKAGNPESKGIKEGSRVQIRIKSFSPEVQSDLSGEAVQTFEVGRHGIKPLNEALLDMRIGEVRRLGIPIGSLGKVYYEFLLIKVYQEREL